MELGEHVNTMTHKFPKEEQYNLLYEFSFNLMNMMIAFKGKIK